LCKFLAAAGDAIWAQGIDVATDEGMQLVARRAGLAWPEVQQAMADDAWRGPVAANREALTKLGLWGVPCFRLGELALWGQDRLWLLARRIENMCREDPGMQA
jgi:2-hydroxychromene-2-carboxylate isomerase